ncbi:hypothetical protein E2320_010735 [Naja naja]|nr:hypothetical protein E2320_010735 [Naja naja]
MAKKKAQRLCKKWALLTNEYGKQIWPDGGSHYAPKLSRIARRHASHKHYQAEGENISRYMAALRKAAQHCGFRELDDIILDQLLTKLDLTLQQTIDEAQAYELSNQSAAEIQVLAELFQQEEISLYIWNRLRMRITCQKKGHLAKVCKALLPPLQSPNFQNNREKGTAYYEDCFTIAALNSFVPFNAATEIWKSYIEKFNCFLEANDLVELTSSRQRVLFLNFCGKQMFDTARALLAPQPLSTVSWDK